MNMQANESISNPNKETSSSQSTGAPLQQQPSDISLSMPESPQGEKTNKWLTIGLVVFALVVLGIAGFFAYQNYQLKKQVEKPSPGPEITPTKELQPTPISTISVPSPIPTADLTADWKTYRNIEYGYEFKYPGNWNIREDAPSIQQLQFIKNGEVQFPGYLGSAGVFFTVEKTLDDPENKGYIFESMYSSTSRCPEEAGEIDLGDTVNVYCLTGKEVQTEVGIWKEAVECSATAIYAFGENPENCPHQFWLDTKNYFYYFHFHVFEPIEEGSEADVTFDQILSTFKFTE